MAERKFYAEITLNDDERAFEDNIGPIDYLEREFGWMEESGLTLNNALIADDDDEDLWARYINYVIDWGMTHTYNENPSGGPMTYKRWFNKVVMNKEVK